MIARCLCFMTSVSCLLRQVYFQIFATTHSGNIYQKRGANIETPTKMADIFSPTPGRAYSANTLGPVLFSIMDSFHI